MRRERGKDPARDPAIAIGLARAEDGIGFIDDNNDGTQGPDGHQNPRLLTLCIPYPFRTKLAHLHHWKTAFASETIDEKRFADTDPARHQNAALEHIGLAVLYE